MLKKPKKEQAQLDLAALPPLPLPALPDAPRAWGIVVAGVGGTGVITIGQLLGMAAHLDGKGVVTQDSAGLAQKGGPTWSHVQIADTPDAIHTTKVDTAKADLVIGCESIVAASRATLALMREGQTYVALNTHATPTAAVVGNPDWQSPAPGCEAALVAAVGADRLGMLDAEAVALQILGDSIYANPLLLGFAWQKGRVPVSHAAMWRAIELNGTQVENNLAAFEWGRRCAHDLAAVQGLFKTAQVIEFVRRPALDEVIAQRVEFLTGYQDAAYAKSYAGFIEGVRQAEAKVGSTRLTEAVARGLFKLMAYKDEYEVARLHTDPAFIARLAAMFEGEPGRDWRIVHHLAPPLWAPTDDKGHLVKSAWRPWVRTAFALLARLKGLRGGALDPFGRTEERRSERVLIGEYRDTISELLQSLDAGNLALAVEIARIPEEIRGFGHVKARNLAAARARRELLLAQWRGGADKGARAA